MKKLLLICLFSVTQLFGALEILAPKSYDLRAINRILISHEKLSICRRNPELILHFMSSMQSTNGIAFTNDLMSNFIVYQDGIESRWVNVNDSIYTSCLPEYYLVVTPDLIAYVHHLQKMDSASNEMYCCDIYDIKKIVEKMRLKDLLKIANKFVS